MQFTTHVGDDLAKSVFEKGAAFAFKYQAVTSESESKVRVFSPFPRISAINLTQATYMVEAFKRAPDSIGVIYISIKTASICISMKHMPSVSRNLKQELAF